MFGVGGSEGVHAFPPTKKAFESLFNTYNDFTRLLELSAYEYEEENGKKVRYMFPMSKMNDRLTALKEKFKKEKRHYVELQSFDIEANPILRIQYYSQDKSQKKAIAHAEANCWPGSQDDERVKVFTDKVDQFCSLANLRDNFEVQIEKYGAARYDFESKLVKIEGVINILEALDGVDSEIVAPVREKTKHEIAEAIKLALETGRCYNSACIWSMSNVTPADAYRGNYS